MPTYYTLIFDWKNSVIAIVKDSNCVCRAIVGPSISELGTYIRICERKKEVQKRKREKKTKGSVTGSENKMERNHGFSKAHELPKPSKTPITWLQVHLCNNEPSHMHAVLVR